jgi:hypothetical protein
VAAANVGRVTLIALLEARWRLPVSEGWPHELAGWLAFLVALGLIASTDALLLFVLGRPAATTPGGSAKPAPPTRMPFHLPAFRATVLSSWPVAAAFSAMAAFQLSDWWFEHRASEAPYPAALGAELMPERTGPWQREGFEVVNRHKRHELGATSQVWRFQNGGDKMLVSLDYPFPGWHDVVYCYKTQGWSPLRPNQPAANAFHTRTQLGAAGGRRGYLWFAAFDARGQDQPVKTLSVRLRDRLSDWAWLAQPGDRQRVQLPVYQAQMLVECYRQLSPEEERQTEQLFADAYSRLKARVAPNPAEVK